MAGLRISTSISSTRFLRQLGQLLRSSLVSPSPLPLVDVGLGHPPAQPGLGDAQILGDLRDGFSRGRASSTARRRNSGGLRCRHTDSSPATIVASGPVSGGRGHFRRGSGRGGGAGGGGSGRGGGAGGGGSGRGGGAGGGGSGRAGGAGGGGSGGGRGVGGWGRVRGAGGSGRVRGQRGSGRARGA